jgi:hypothetical protein
MSGELRCPSCGESERLAGTRADDDIEVTCQTCGHRWLRGSPRCRACGGDEVVTGMRLMTRQPRGNQLAVVGHREVPLCPRCDAEALRDGGRLVPEGYVSRFLFGRDDPRPVQPARRSTKASAPGGPRSEVPSGSSPAPSSGSSSARTPHATPQPSKDAEPAAPVRVPTVRQAIESFLEATPSAEPLTMVMLGRHLGPSARLEELDHPGKQQQLERWFSTTWGTRPDDRRAAAAASLTGAVDHWREQGWLSGDPAGFLR